MYYETDWTESDLKKRVVRYITRAASTTEVASYSWKDACKRLVQQAMGTYGTACKDRAWVLCLDLSDALSEAAWEMLQSQPVGRLPRSRDVYAVVHDEFHDCLDSLEIHSTFGVIAQKHFSAPYMQRAVERILYHSHCEIAEGVRAHPSSEDYENVVAFVGAWMNDALDKIWSLCVGAHANALTEEVAVELFGDLIAPYGEEHEFSCIPHYLYKDIGAPPPDWPFIQEQVERVFQGFTVVEVDRPAKVQRTNPPPSAEAADAAAGAPDAAGHPRCTCEEACAGSPSSSLVVHLVPVGTKYIRRGDVYCKVCWNNFLGENDRLLGMTIEPPGHPNSSRGEVSATGVCEHFGLGSGVLSIADEFVG